ncbi:MAG: transcription antitermination factor NusB [Nitrospirota bacterium]
MKRRTAREYALQFLYRIDFVNVPEGSARTFDLETDSAALREDINAFWEEVEDKDPEIKAFAEGIILGTIGNLAVIDALLQKVAEKWKLSRMATIDRNILRFATYELLFRKDIPSAVTINEALEIAKKYSTAESAAFINGLLDRIAREHGTKSDKD